MCCYGRFVWSSGAAYLENMSGLRKQWGMQGEQGYRPFNPTPVKARPRNGAAEDHSYHLLMLQERNRLLKRLSQKGQREVEMERKEQGFSLYLNGANTAPHHHHHRSQPRSSAMTDDQQHPSPQSQSRPSRTAAIVRHYSGANITLLQVGWRKSHLIKRGGREQLRPGRVGATRQWYSEQRTARLSPSPLQVLSAVAMTMTLSRVLRRCQRKRVLQRWRVGEERGGERESSEAHSTEDEELTESLQELSQQVSSLENTLTTSGSHQDSLVEGRQISAETESLVEGRQSSAETERQETALRKRTEAVWQKQGKKWKMEMELLQNNNKKSSSPQSPSLQLLPHQHCLNQNFLNILIFFLLFCLPIRDPVSTRSTGLRGEIATRTLVSETNESSLLRDQSTGGMGDSRASNRLYRSGSGRTSGIRGQLLSRAHSDHAIGTSWLGDQPARLTGVRGALHSPGHTSSEPDILHCPRSRPHTVVLEPGPNRMEPGSLPTWEAEINDSDPLPLLTDESRDSAHWPHPSPDLNESLEALSFFDHTHQGQLGSTTGRLRESLIDPKPTETEPLSPSPHPEGSPREEEEGGYSTPELPTGQELVLNLLTTWGDQFYIGLTGLEIFTASGERACIDQISADPADINVLPGYSRDPRVVSNLLDGVHHTNDDLHMWLAPFTPSQPHTITISLSSPTSLAVVRVWNYNKSRIHSYRGVRDMEMWLDQQLIFRGEIRRQALVIHSLHVQYWWSETTTPGGRRGQEYLLEFEPDSEICELDYDYPLLAIETDPPGCIEGLVSASELRRLWENRTLPVLYSSPVREISLSCPSPSNISGILVGAYPSMNGDGLPQIFVVDGGRTCNVSTEPVTEGVNVYECVLDPPVAVDGEVSLTISQRHAGSQIGFLHDGQTDTPLISLGCGECSSSQLLSESELLEMTALYIPYIIEREDDEFEYEDLTITQNGILCSVTPEPVEAGDFISIVLPAYSSARLLLSFLFSDRGPIGESLDGNGDIKDIPLITLGVDSQSSSDNTGVIVGAVMGLILAVLLFLAVVLLLVFILCRRKRTKYDEKEEEKREMTEEERAAMDNPVYSGGRDTESGRPEDRGSNHMYDVTTSQQPSSSTNSGQVYDVPDNTPSSNDGRKINDSFDNPGYYSTIHESTAPQTTRRSMQMLSSNHYEMAIYVPTKVPWCNSLFLTVI
ncbi:Katanin-interacting protein [Geodia barretti]|uniref:Katanin-interacting protein n=1 Tax=Geodia barretti TaxID=519541 RepID=A0AA35QXX0_GEOBA|nr:Katanin-interacting protein [Geodia barretti]